jgi:uncharacterized integral membrane protein (TIGR00697 family)
MFLNVLLWVGMIVGTFGLILLAYRLFGFFGLIAFSALALIIANVQVLKQVDIFTLAATLGNVVFSATFLTTDILSEIYGKAKAKLAVHIGFFSMITFLILMQLTLMFTPSAGDWAQPHLEALFTILPRITVASLIAYFISNRHDVWAFEYWKKRLPGDNKLWVRNNASTLVSQLLDSIIFSFIAFLGVFPLEIVIQIALSTYIFKVFVAIADTPFVYIARWMHRTGRTGLFLNKDEIADVPAETA